LKAGVLAGITLAMTFHHASKSLLAALVAAALSACGGEESRTPESVGWSHVHTDGAFLADIRLTQGQLQGVVCEDAWKNFELELLVAGEVVGTSRTEWASADTHACTQHKRFSAFRLAWPADTHERVSQEGALLRIRHAGVIRHEVRIPAVPTLASKWELWLNSPTEGVAGLYCADEGALVIRGELQQPDYPVPGYVVPSPWADCRTARAFELKPSELQAQAVRHHWFPSDSLHLWQVSEQGASVLATLNWRADSKVHQIPYLEAGANELNDMLAMPFEPDSSIYPARGRAGAETVAQAGIRQGLSAVAERQAGRTPYNRYQLLNLDKRLKTSTPFEDIQTFAQAFRSTGANPGVLYVLDEPFWKSFGDVVEPANQAAHLEDYETVVRAYRASFPQTPLMAAVNGVVLLPQVYADARHILNQVDLLLFDPYTVYASIFPSLYEEGMRLQAQRCPVKEWDRLDSAVSECLVTLFGDLPGKKFGWLGQAFTIADTPGIETESYAPYVQGLRRHWRAMREVATRHAERSFAVGTFGYRLSEFSLINEPLLRRAADMKPQDILSRDISAFAAKDPR
jgi:hypothetical protein